MWPEEKVLQGRELLKSIIEKACRESGISEDLTLKISDEIMGAIVIEDVRWEITAFILRPEAKAG